MPLYQVTIRYEGTKTFEYESVSFEDAVAEANGIEHQTNPIDERVDETIIEVKEVERK